MFHIFILGIQSEPTSLFFFTKEIDYPIFSSVVKKLRFNFTVCFGFIFSKNNIGRGSSSSIFSMFSLHIFMGFHMPGFSHFSTFPNLLSIFFGKIIFSDLNPIAQKNKTNLLDKAFLGYNAVFHFFRVKTL